MNEKTIQRTIRVSGIGLHTGERVSVTLHPAEPGAGILFRVRNFNGVEVIPALVPFVIDTRRRVVLGRSNVTVQTVEHLLAACFGLGITDLLVDVKGSELPIGDGSAQIWVDAFKEAGLAELDESPPTFAPENIEVNDDKGVVKVEPAPYFSAFYTFVTEHPLVGTQKASFNAESDDFVLEIAPARTFGFWEEVQHLWEQGLAKGGSLENALVVFPDKYSSSLRFPNELARHKLLDLMGDLMLLGFRLRAKVDARSSGHALHFRLCQVLWQRVEQEARAQWLKHRATWM